MPKANATIDEKAYIKSGGTYCPFCKSANVARGLVDAIGASARQNVTCDDCCGEWLEIYRMTSVEIVAEPKAED